MSKFFKLAAPLLIGLQVLLLFLFFFESKVELPLLLSPLGRMHPLFLHIPIGVFLVAVILQFIDRFFGKVDLSEVLTFLFAFSAITAAVTAIFGFFLGLESGYDLELLKDHKRTGVLTSIGCWLSYLAYSGGWNYAKIPSVVTLGVMTFAGHLGGEITHGEDYVLAPLRPTEERAFKDDAPLYEQAIFPILKAKCVACHNDKKQKGELNMATLTKLMKGGENGPLWEAGSALNSHLISNANLPLDDKMHMPPKGKPQLTALEIALLTRWIDDGADTGLTLDGLEKGDTLRDLVLQQYPIKVEGKKYDFKAASSDLIAEMNTPFCSVVEIANGSVALQASFFVSQRFDVEQLKNLSKVSEQIVSLNLSKMPLEDKDLDLLTSFENLEKLILNYTNLTGEGIEKLAQNKKLNHLSLTGIKLAEGSLSKLEQIEGLSALYVWNTGLEKEEITSFIKSNPQVKLYQGFEASDDDILKINPPQLANKKAVFGANERLLLKHGLNDVEIRYTTDGSMPDSLKSDVYESGLEVNGFTRVKAVATKDGWYASDVKTYSVFQSTYAPDTAWLASPTNKQYPGKGVKTVTDGKQGDPDNFRDLTWLGYLGENAEIVFKRKPSDAYKGITVSYLKNPGSSIMTPMEIQLWGSQDEKGFKLLETRKPSAMKDYEPSSFDAETFTLKDSYAYYKVICKPLSRLPAWHTRKGDRSWVFLDEIYFY